MTRPTGRGGRPEGRRAVRDEPVDEPADEPVDEPADATPDGDDRDDIEDAPGPRRGAERITWLDSLYRGNGGLDIVGRAKTWYAVFGVVLLVCVLSMVLRGFNFGIDFEGGSTIQFPARGVGGVADTGQVTEVFDRTVGSPPESVQVAGAGDSATVLVRSERLGQGQVVALRQAFFDRFQPLGRDGAPDSGAVTDSAVSASWGGEITRQALIALAVFLVLVTIYLIFYFEPRMAFAALVALANDIIITAGVYSLVGFEVSPATVIGLLTILGFSLYDTVVVFDKVRENTRGLLGLTRRTYAEAANLAVNQTLMRSLNTALIAALPLIGLFVVGVVLLGVGVLGDLALVQLVGTVVGAGSSILLATPIVVDLAMRDRKWAQQAQKVAARRARGSRGGRDGGRRGGDTGPADRETGESTDVLDGRAVAAASGRARPGATATREAPGLTPRPGARPSGKSGRPAGKRRK